MKTLKLNFADFDPNFEFSAYDNYFTHLLSKHYHVEISDHPDLLIYSNYGKDFQRFNCTRVFFTVENIRPDYHECDYSFSFDLDKSERHFRLPSYCFYGHPYPFYGDPANLVKSGNNDPLSWQKKKFCCFVVSNPYNPLRNKFYHTLSKYKKIDSGGRFLNNLGYVVGNKIEFIKDYKFIIAFENESWPGYTTEKIFEAMQAGVIPIYWGNPYINQEFNTKSFINCHDYQNFDRVIEQIIRIDKDDALYANYLKEPFFTDNRVPEAIRPETVLEKMADIVEKMEARIPVAVSGRNYKYIRNSRDLLIKMLVFAIPLSFKKTYLPYYRRVISFPSKCINAVKQSWNLNMKKT